MIFLSMIRPIYFFYLFIPVSLHFSVYIPFYFFCFVWMFYISPRIMSIQKKKKNAKEVEMDLSCSFGAILSARICFAESAFSKADYFTCHFLSWFKGIQTEKLREFTFGSTLAHPYLPVGGIKANRIFQNNVRKCII